MSGPLEGLRVLDLTRLQPGNYATMVLGDLGADVVKVEEPGRGDYVRWTPPMVGESSAMHQVLNRNKRSVTLNLKKPEGAGLLMRLAAKADVLIESFRPGVMERLGVGYEKLAEANPGLVYAAITGYGQTGPYRDRAGHDINYIATAGILGTTGPAGGPPVLPSVQIADLSGAMMAVIGLLAALWRKTSSGRGEFVDVSMMDVSLSWLALHLAPWFAGAPQLERSSGYLNGGFPFYRTYECADGKFISVGALEPQFWAALCTAIGHVDLISEQYAPEARRAEIHAILEETFRAKPRDEWVAALSGLDTCVAAVNDFTEMAADPQVQARGIVTEVPRPGAESWKDLGVAVALLNNPGAIRIPAPGLGEHNTEIYSEIGLEPAELEKLSAAGVI
jgi:crotonobetainyl-CoA:carnitine CoA-transferase CaiB-like acyl-CoA transferase